MDTIESLSIKTNPSSIPNTNKNSNKSKYTLCFSMTLKNKIIEKEIETDSTYCRIKEVDPHHLSITTKDCVLLLDRKHLNYFQLIKSK